MARGKSSVLTEKQDKYVEARMDGKSKCQAAKAAGYAVLPSNIEKIPEVNQSLQNMRQELSSATQITRADVIDMIKEAYDMARLMSEPSSMVSAAKEIGKILGVYEPQVVKHELNSSQSNLQQKLLVMSDAELLQLVIEGEFSRVQ